MIVEIVDPIDMFGDGLQDHRVTSDEAKANARAAGDLVAAVEQDGTVKTSLSPRLRHRRSQLDHPIDPSAQPTAVEDNLPESRTLEEPSAAKPARTELSDEEKQHQKHHRTRTMTARPFLNDYLIGELHSSRNVEQFGTARLPRETLHYPVMHVLAVCHLGQLPEDVHVELLL